MPTEQWFQVDGTKKFTCKLPAEFEICSFETGDNLVLGVLTPCVVDLCWVLRQRIPLDALVSNNALSKDRNPRSKYRITVQAYK